MPYVRTRPMRRGMGTDVQHGNAYYDSVTGRYLGGSAWMDYWCGSWAGATLDPVCRIPTPADIRAQQAADLQKTSAPQSAIDAALAAGDAAVKADAAANPADYQAQIAAANHPSLSALFGPSFTNLIFPVDVSDPNNPKSGTPWLLYIGIGLAGVFAISEITGGRR